MKKSHILGKIGMRAVLMAALAILCVGVWQPEAADAAQKSFKGTGKSAVAFSDKESKGEDGKLVAHYVKYKAGVTGYVTLKFSEKSNMYKWSIGYVTLCDENKKPIGQREYWTNKEGLAKYPYDTRMYGVRKGETYYFKLECDGGTRIAAKVTKVAKSKANSRKNAEALPQGKTADGVIIAGEKTADWYKITLPRTAKLKIELVSRTNGDATGGYKTTGVRMTFCRKDGKKWSNTSSLNLTLGNASNSLDVYMADKNGNKFDIPTGTYYVKFEPMSKQSSGYYKVKWNAYN